MSSLVLLPLSHMKKQNRIYDNLCKHLQATCDLLSSVLIKAAEPPSAKPKRRSEFWQKKKRIRLPSTPAPATKLMHVVWQSGLQLRPFKHPNKSHLLPCTAVNVASQSGPMMWVLLCAVPRNVKVFLMLFWTPARHCQVRDHRLRQRFNSCKLEHTGYF